MRSVLILHEWHQRKLLHQASNQLQQYFHKKNLITTEVTSLRVLFESLETRKEDIIIFKNESEMQKNKELSKVVSCIDNNTNVWLLEVGSMNDYKDFNGKSKDLISSSFLVDADNKYLFSMFGFFFKD